MWQLHLPDHSHWHLVDRSITLLEEAFCDASSSDITTVPASNHPRISDFMLTCQRQDQSTLFSVTEVIYRDKGKHTEPRRQEVMWSGMTKDRLWHRLASAPDLLSVRVSLSAQVVGDPIAVISKP